MWKTKSKMADISPTLSQVILNINKWNAPIKRQRLADGFFFKKRRTWLNYVLSTETKFKGTNRSVVKWWTKVYHRNSKQQRATVVILISDKTNFETKKLLLQTKRDIF